MPSHDPLKLEPNGDYDPTTDIQPVMVNSLLVPNRSFLVDPFLPSKNHIRSKHAGSFSFPSSSVHGQKVLITFRKPTLNPDSSPSRDIALFSRFAVHTMGEYGRDDIVTVRFCSYWRSFAAQVDAYDWINRSPENPNRVLIKRILAIEGDTVRTLPPYPDAEVKIPQGHVWVEGKYLLTGFLSSFIEFILGDEHFVSDDSNRFGPVDSFSFFSPPTQLILFFSKISAGLVESKLVMLIWPLNRFGRLKKPRETHPRDLDQATLDELKKEHDRHSRLTIGKS